MLNLNGKSCSKVAFALAGLFVVLSVPVLLTPSLARRYLGECTMGTNVFKFNLPAGHSHEIVLGGLARAHLKSVSDGELDPVERIEITMDNETVFRQKLIAENVVECNWLKHYGYNSALILTRADGRKSRSATIQYELVAKQSYTVTVILKRESTNSAALYLVWLKRPLDALRE